MRHVYAGAMGKGEVTEKRFKTAHVLRVKVLLLRRIFPARFSSGKCCQNNVRSLHNAQKKKGFSMFVVLFDNLNTTNSLSGSFENAITPPPSSFSVHAHLPYLILEDVIFQR